jgi:hypothetical protein
MINMSTNTIVIFNIFIFLLGCGEVNVAQHDDAKVKTDEKAEIISDSKDAALDSDTLKFDELQFDLSTDNELPSDQMTALDDTGGEIIDPCAETPKPDGCPCDDSAECASLICGETFKGKECLPLCMGMTACPDGMECKLVPVGSDMVYVCVPFFVHLCQPCYTNNECQPDGMCMAFGNEGSFCISECSDEIKCPDGYVCDKSFCLPESGICACSEKAIKFSLSTDCYKENIFGKCKGKRVCTKQGLSPCDAEEASEEVCNGVDDNCDGNKDEGMPDCCVCGNGKCEEFPACGETLANCAVDCHACGNGKCEPAESPKDCPQDCCGWCGDAKCANYPKCTETKDTCPDDCAVNPCGDGNCDKGENPLNCPADCKKDACGNGVCEPDEDLNSATPCDEDCAASCGNCICEGTEDFISCPNDCGYCGDGTCSSCPSLNESIETCEKDCCKYGDFCFIDGSCYQKGTENPGNECEICDTNADKKKWTAKADNTICNADDNGCTKDDICINGFCVASIYLTRKV